MSQMPAFEIYSSPTCPRRRKYESVKMLKTVSDLFVDEFKKRDFFLSVDEYYPSGELKLSHVNLSHLSSAEIYEVKTRV